MNLISVAAAAILVMASLNEAAPTTKAAKPASGTVNRADRLPGLEKIKHIVYFMQENRSFDNYYGTMSGVRGFADPNVGIQGNGLNLLYQPCSASSDVKNGTKYLLPYNLQGQRAGCTAGGSNGWTANHKANNNGKNDNWPDGNSPNSMGYLTRSQIPFLYSLADEFTIADMYFQSVIGPTNPNRAMWMSGSINAGSTGYVLEDNNESIALDWTTFPEKLTASNVTWQVFQDKDNFDDNALAWFKYWRELPDGAEKDKGLGFPGLQAFYDAAANGTLPQFSIIVGPTELSEHPNNTPLAGSWIQQQVVNAVMNGKNWKETALFINYDESGGYFDHVIPPQAPSDEWVTDKFVGGKTHIGFGPRVPMVVVSPWTRGGNVFSEVSDHTSTLKFMEEWVGKDNSGKYLAPAENISPWSRKTASNLVNVFDFSNPDYSIPKFDPVPKPAQTNGKWSPTEMCESIITAPKSTPPYGKQVYPVVEAGARRIRGAVTEGRKLAFELNNGNVLQLSADSKKLQAQKVQKGGNQKAQFSKESLFQLIVTGTSNQYKIQSVANPAICLNVWGSGLDLGECKGTAWYFEQHDDHYHIRDVGTDSFLSVQGANQATLSSHHDTHFKVYSVTE